MGTENIIENNTKTRLESEVAKIEQDRADYIGELTGTFQAFSAVASIALQIVQEEMKKENATPKESKKKKWMADAKEVIDGLLNNIATAKTEEEVIQLRKKLNSYINKIKKELQSRPNLESETTSYAIGVDKLRKNVSAYIRILKRQKNIEKIKGTINTLGDVIDKVEDDLKKTIKLELQYNKRLIKRGVDVQVSIPTKKEPVAKSTYTAPKAEKVNFSNLPENMQRELMREAFDRMFIMYGIDTPNEGNAYKGIDEPFITAGNPTTEFLVPDEIPKETRIKQIKAALVGLNHKILEVQNMRSFIHVANVAVRRIRYNNDNNLNKARQSILACLSNKSKIREIAEEIFNQSKELNDNVPDSLSALAEYIYDWELGQNKGMNAFVTSEKHSPKTLKRGPISWLKRNINKAA